MSVIYEGFRWSKCPDGYDAETKKIKGTSAASILLSGTTLKPNSSKRKNYRPGEIIGLHRKLADIPQTQTGALSFTNEFGVLNDNMDDQDLEGLLRHAKGLQQAVKEIDNDNPESAANWFNKHVSANMTAKIYPIIENKRPLQLYPVPNSLIGYIWLSVGEEITGGKSFRKCLQCPEYIHIGSGARSARAKFCSDSCRVQWNRVKHAN